ncbi:MAG: ferritin-like domain-containing protein [Clostridia bacterium]|nr:ferritin-like domain-containing protein [Clostridia bacterium]
MTLTQKEMSLLKDLKDQEQLCIDKYTKHASCAVDPQLKNLFSQLASAETQHLQGLCELEKGTVPQQNGSGNSQMPTFTKYHNSENQDKKNDCYLCTDLLTGEKGVSSLYNTCIFEFVDENARTYLNSIQKQEQNHGKMIYDYMTANAMY